MDHSKLYRSSPAKHYQMIFFNLLPEFGPQEAQRAARARVAAWNAEYRRAVREQFRREVSNA